MNHSFHSLDLSPIQNSAFKIQNFLWLRHIPEQSEWYMEVRIGFEPMWEGFADLCVTTPPPHQNNYLLASF